MSTEREDGRQDQLVSATYRALATEKTPRHLDDEVLKRAAAGGRTRYSLAYAWMRPVAWAATIGLCLAIALELSQLPQSTDPLLMDETTKPAAAPAISAPEPAQDFAKAIERKHEASMRRNEKVMPESLAIDEVRMRDDATTAGEPGAPDTNFVRETREQDATGSGPEETVEVTGALRQRSQAASATAATVSEAAALLPEASACSEEARQTAADWFACIVELKDAGETELADRELSLFMAEFPDFQAPVPE